MTERKDGLTHLDAEGHARMVDVSDKDLTRRRAVAEGCIVMAAETLRRIVAGETTKGDVIRIAELAGVMAAKKTADLIPLCHALPGTSVRVTLEPDQVLPGLRAGVEMEALTAVSVALLTVYDMAKAIDRGMRIEQVRLVAKEGGRSGTWTAER
jgi:cyclic pyranopterin phosphate synthase